jgi:hypothetical protein
MQSGDHVGVLMKRIHNHTGLKPRDQRLLVGSGKLKDIILSTSFSVKVERRLFLMAGMNKGEGKNL